MNKSTLFFIAILFLSALYLLGPAPNAPIYSTILPIITTDADAFVGQTELNPRIKKNNEAEITWLNDSTKNKTEYVLLYLHGYSASKMEGQPVYLDFAKRYGCNVFAARLADQGIDTVAPMYKYSAERLWKSALEAIVVAKKLGDKVIIMSTSTGGTLALKMAAEFPNDVTALINLSPNIRPKPWNAFLLNDPWGLQITRAVLGGDFRTLPKRDTIYEKYWYDSYRIESLVQMQEFVESTMIPATFEQVNCPVLNVFYFKDKTRQDEVIEVEKIFWMHELLATKPEQKWLIAIDNAETHVIGCGLYSKAINEVEQATYRFAEEVLKLNPITAAK